MEIRGEALEIAYGEYVAVSSVSVRVRRDRVTTIIGPNGSGKSTLLKGLTRLLPCRGGKVYVDGRDLAAFGAKEPARRVGVLPQAHTAPPDFKVKDLVGYGRMPYQKWYARNSEEDERIVDWAMRATGVYALRDKSIHQCSGGERQRVWIATVLTQQPEILFLDEPTTYLDIAHQLELLRLVKRLNRESGIGVVMVLHDLTQALEVSDWIVVVKDGRKYGEGAPEDVITPAMLKEVYDVDCYILRLPGREKPLIVFRELGE